MSEKKISLMHRLFGATNHICKECGNFKRHKYHDRVYRKCLIYGDTNSEATDWNASYQACGKFNESYDGTPVVEWKKSQPKTKTIERIEGQEEMKL